MDWPARVIFRDAAAAILRRPVWTRPVMAAFELGKKKKNRNKKQNKTKKHRMRSKKRKSSHRPIEPSVGRRNPHLCRSQRNKRSKKATRSVAVVRRNEKWTKSAERKRDRERERERGLCEVVRVPRRSVIRNALRRNCADYCALVSLVRSPSRARRSRRVFRFFLSFSSFRWHPLAISWFRSVTELYWVLLGFI